MKSRRKSFQKKTFIILGIILIAGIFTANALITGTRHAQNQINLNVGTTSKTLQNAISDGSVLEASGTFCNGKTCGSTPCGGYCAPNNCASGTHCDGGNCVSDMYCGDGSCNNGETCSSCSGDCGSCQTTWSNPQYVGLYILGRVEDAQAFCTLQGMSYVSSTIEVADWHGEAMCRMNRGSTLLDSALTHVICAPAVSAPDGYYMPRVTSVTCTI
jgi:hypothetical protein